MLVGLVNSCVFAVCVLFFFDRTGLAVTCATDGSTCIVRWFPATLMRSNVSMLQTRSSTIVQSAVAVGANVRSRHPKSVVQKKTAIPVAKKLPKHDPPQLVQLQLLRLLQGQQPRPVNVQPKPLQQVVVSWAWAVLASGGLRLHLPR